MKQGISDQISSTSNRKKRKRPEKTLDISDRQFIEGDDGFYRYTMPTGSTTKRKSKLIYFLNTRAKDFEIDGPIKFEHDKNNKEQIIIVPKEAGQIWTYLMEEKKRHQHQGTNKRQKISYSDRKFIEKDGMFYHFSTGTQSLYGIQKSIEIFARKNLKISDLDVAVDYNQKAICMTKESYARWIEAINNYSHQSSKRSPIISNYGASPAKFNVLKTNLSHELSEEELKRSQVVPTQPSFYHPTAEIPSYNTTPMISQPSIFVPETERFELLWLAQQAYTNRIIDSIEKRDQDQEEREEKKITSSPVI